MRLASEETALLEEAFEKRLEPPLLSRLLLGDFTFMSSEEERAGFLGDDLNGLGSEEKRVGFLGDDLNGFGSTTMWGLGLHMLKKFLSSQLSKRRGV